jgi:cytochrome c-type biogenesis protein CcmH
MAKWLDGLADRRFSMVRNGFVARWTSVSMKRAGYAGSALMALIAAGLLLLLVTAPVVAQEPTLDEINAVARELWCPLCNGVRLDTCDLQACIQMREVIGQKLAAGVPKEQIKAEFVAQYGPIVLGEPPRQGLNNLVGWILPVAAILIGGGWLLTIVLRWTRRPTQAETGPAAQAEPATAPGNDDYLARVEADLAKLD